VTPTWILATVLTQAALPAAECPRDDNACKARRHERRAKAATTPEDRAYYLHLAHRSYLFSFDRSGDVDDLCAARRNLDASLAIAGQSNQQRESTLAAQKDLLAREEKSPTSCRQQDRTPRRARAPEPPPRVAAAHADVLRVDPPVHAHPQAVTTQDGQAPQTRPVAAAQTSATAEPSPARVPAIPSPASGDAPIDALIPVPSRGASPRPGRGLVIAGGATLGVGLALAGVAGYMGGRTLDARRQADALGVAVDGYADDEQLAQDRQLTRDYELRATQTLALALAGGTTVVVAAVLLGVGGRRMARIAVRAALAPMPGGLVFHARF
jgi:hypothetical protein